MLNEAVNQATTEATEGWNTPQKIVDLVRQVAPIALDPCSNAGSLVQADRVVCLPEDGLLVDWYEATRMAPPVYGTSGRPSRGLVYVNPPYSRKGVAFIEKCSREANRGTEIIALLPARTDTAAFHGFVFGTSQAICFWAGRLKFSDAKCGAPFPSALVYWGVRVDRFREVFAAHGQVILP